MTENRFSVVTGAFSYTGRYIARRLLSDGERVKTLTDHPDRPDPFGGRVVAMPYNFDNPEELARSLAGADVLYNTYWVRFARGGVTHDTAVRNTEALIRAAEAAGVSRFVHIGITNASADSTLPYFRGKGLVRDAIKASKLPYAIVNPALLFGREDILVNNIAWALRRFPVFMMYGSGSYNVQPVYVGDLANIAVDAGHREGNIELDAVGPDVYTFEGLVSLIAEHIGREARFVHLRPGIAHLLFSVAGMVLRDVILTRDEIDGLMAGLLVSGGPPTAPMRLADWLGDDDSSLGLRYESELKRHFV